jgi:uncharacterized membrane protein YedE/YeeE
MSTLAALAIGACFGFLLQKAGLSRYERIVGVYRFRDLAVLEFLLSALATAALGIQALESAGLVAATPVPSTYPLGNVLGGAVFGVGMALSGFCPGTVTAGAGEGRLDSLVAGGAGLVVGALVYGELYDRIMPALARGAVTITIPRWLGANPWPIVILLVELAAFVVYALRSSVHHERSRRKSVRFAASTRSR